MAIKNRITPTAPSVGESARDWLLCRARKEHERAAAMESHGLFAAARSERTCGLRRTTT